MSPDTFKRVETFKRMVAKAIEFLGAANATRCEVDETAVEEDQPLLNFPDLGLWVVVNAPVKVKSICGEREVPGYQVGYYKVHNNYPHAPDDAEDVVHGDYVQMHDALVALACLYTSNVVTQLHYAESQEG